MSMQSNDPSHPVIAAIVAVARNGAIGKDGGLPWHIPEDLRYFKKMTLGKPMIMGRKCFQSFGKPLPGRLNIVVTRDPSQFAPAAGLVIVGDLDAAFAAAHADCRGTGAAEIMVIGGAQIYAETLPLTQRIYLTRIERDYAGDIFLPPYDAEVWQTVSEERHEGDPSYNFTILERRI